MPPKFRKAGGGITLSVRASASERLHVGETDAEEAALANSRRFVEIAKRAELDAQMGFVPFVAGGARIGWMLNMQPVWPLASRRQR